LVSRIRSGKDFVSPSPRDMDGITGPYVLDAERTVCPRTKVGGAARLLACGSDVPAICTIEGASNMRHFDIPISDSPVRRRIDCMHMLRPYVQPSTQLNG